ncbi:hypothetical protein Tco_0788227 [Tanacetum coccineum]
MISSIKDIHHGTSDAMHNPSRPLKVIDEEQLAFLADPGVTQGPDTQIIMPINVAFQTDDLDAFDSNCDEAPLAKAMLMANFSSYDSDVNLEKAQRIKPTLYDGNVLTKKHDVISMINSEETLILAEESRSKMTEKQNDPISKEKNELSAEQAFWLPILNLTSEQLVVQPTPVKTEVPHELPKVIPFMNSLMELFKDFDYGLHLELNEKKAIFNQIEAEVEQCFVHTAINFIAAVVDCSKSVNNSRVIAPGMYKIDLQPLPSILRKNKEVHEDYLKITKDHTDTLRRIVEKARDLEPLFNALYFACTDIAKIIGK